MARKRGPGLERWKLNLTVLWFGQFIVMSGMTMIMPFLPLYIQELGIQDEKSVALWAGIIFASTFVTSFWFQPLWGKLSDRYGRKVMVIRSGIGMSIVTILMGSATSVWHLLFLRILNGTISGFIPAATALLSATTPKKHAGFAMGVLQSGGVAGTILGPFIGGLVADWVGFRPIFYVTGLLILIATLLTMFFVKEPFDRKQAAKQTNMTILQSLSEIKKVPQLPALFAVTFMIQFAMLSHMPQIPLYIQHIHGNVEWIAFLSGLVSSITGLSNMLASPVLGRIGDKHGSERVLSICLIGAALCLVPQALVQNVWQLLVIRFLFGCFIGGLLPSVNALIRHHTPDGMEGRAFSFNTSSFALGNMIGPVVGGLISGLIGIREIFWVGAIMMVINYLWVKKTLVSPALSGEAEAKPGSRERSN